MFPSLSSLSLSLSLSTQPILFLVAKQVMKNRSMFGCSDMKKSLSELALEELFASHEDDKINMNNNKADHIFAASHFHNSHHSEIMKEISSPAASSLVEDYSKNLQRIGGSSITTTTTTGSSSSDEELEMEGGDDRNKRMKRMVSNRESARRSRRRKQQELEEVEEQVQHLRGDHSSLFKHLSHASLQLKHAATNFRLLKAHVQALKAHLKLAEDMLPAPATSSTHLLHHDYLNITSTTPHEDHDHYIMSNINIVPQGDLHDHQFIINNNSPSSYKNINDIIGADQSSCGLNLMTNVPQIWTNTWEGEGEEEEDFHHHFSK